MKLSDAVLLVNGNNFTYNVEFRKVGYIINSHFIVEGVGSDIRIASSQDERFNRIVSTDGTPNIVVTDSEIRVYVLKRQSSCLYLSIKN